jgi:hypothetical protein
MEKAAEFYHDHAGSTGIRVAVGQPEEGHRISLAQVQRLAPTILSRGASAMRTRCFLRSLAQDTGPYGSISRLGPLDAPFTLAVHAVNPLVP